MTHTGHALRAFEKRGDLDPEEGPLSAAAVLFPEKRSEQTSSFGRKTVLFQFLAQKNVFLQNYFLFSRKNKKFCSNIFDVTENVNCQKTLQRNRKSEMEIDTILIWSTSLSFSIV